MAALPQLEAMYTPQELAELWKFHPTTIQRMFKDEPGVLVYGEENRRDRKRDYTTLRIPASVAQRVYERFRRKA
jgi:hypothetical protein